MFKTTTRIWSNSLALFRMGETLDGEGPQGVQIEHRSLTNYVLACVHYLSMSDATVQLNFFGVAFDGALCEIYPPLTTGGAP